MKVGSGFRCFVVEASCSEPPDRAHALIFFTSSSEHSTDRTLRNVFSRSFNERSYRQTARLKICTV